MDEDTKFWMDFIMKIIPWIGAIILVLFGIIGFLCKKYIVDKISNLEEKYDNLIDKFVKIGLEKFPEKEDKRTDTYNPAGEDRREDSMYNL